MHFADEHVVYESSIKEHDLRACTLRTFDLGQGVDEYNLKQLKPAAHILFGLAAECPSSRQRHMIKSRLWPPDRVRVLESRSSYNGHSEPHNSSFHSLFIVRADIAV